MRRAVGLCVACLDKLHVRIKGALTTTLGCQAWHDLPFVSESGRCLLSLTDQGQAWKMNKGKAWKVSSHKNDAGVAAILTIQLAQQCSPHPFCIRSIVQTPPQDFCGVMAFCNQEEH